MGILGLDSVYFLSLRGLCEELLFKLGMRHEAGVHAWTKLGCRQILLAEECHRKGG